MGPFQCSWCEKCQSNPAEGPNSHSTERTPHRMVCTKVEVDDGHGTLTRCIWCHRTKAEIAERGEPMEGFDPNKT